MTELLELKAHYKRPQKTFTTKCLNVWKLTIYVRTWGSVFAAQCVTLYGNSSEDLQVHSSLYLQGLFELSLVLGIALGPAIGGGLQEVSMYICIDVYVTATRDLYTYGVFQCVLSD